MKLQNKSSLKIISIIFTAVFSIMCGLMLSIKTAPVTVKKVLYVNPENITVYWTKSSTMYHTHQDCKYLKNSKSVLQGTAAEATADRKQKLCSICSNTDGGIIIK